MCINKTGIKGRFNEKPQVIKIKCCHSCVNVMMMKKKKKKKDLANRKEKKRNKKWMNATIVGRRRSNERPRNTSW